MQEMDKSSTQPHLIMEQKVFIQQLRELYPPLVFKQSQLQVVFEMLFVERGWNFADKRIAKEDRCSMCC